MYYWPKYVEFHFSITILSNFLRFSFFVLHIYGEFCTHVLQIYTPVPSKNTLFPSLSSKSIRDLNIVVQAKDVLKIKLYWRRKSIKIDKCKKIKFFRRIIKHQQKTCNVNMQTLTGCDVMTGCNYHPCFYRKIEKMPVNM